MLAWIMGFAAIRFSALGWGLPSALFTNRIFILVGLLLIALIPCYFNLQKVSKLLCALAGGWWAFAHSFSPPGPQHSTPVRVIAHETFSYKVRPALVESSEHKQRYLVYTSASTGTEGRLHCTNLQNGTEVRCRFHGRDLATVSPSVINSFISRIAKRVRARLDAFDAQTAGWLALFLFGDERNLSPQMKAAFKSSGLYHLLVISGFHVSFLGRAFSLILIGALNLLFAARVLRPHSHFHLFIVVQFSVAVWCILFAMLVGMSAASQRAAFAFAVWTISPMLFPTISSRGCLVQILSIQMLLFPLGVTSAGNLMSWLGYLVIVASSSGAGFGAMMKVQFAMFGLSGLLFNQWSFWGLVLNPLCGELFSLIVILYVMVFILGDSVPVIQVVANGLIESFCEMISTLLESTNPEVLRLAGSSNYIFQVLAIGFMIFFILPVLVNCFCVNEHRQDLGELKNGRRLGK